MTTINISLPERLKKEADTLVGEGYYVSFSDLVRDGLRNIIDTRRYDRWYREAKQDEKEGRAVVLKSKKDIANYFKKL